MKQALGESLELLESLQAMNTESHENIYDSLIEGFETADSVAATLGRKFCVLEESMLHMEMKYDYKNQNAMMLGVKEKPPVESPESEHGEEGDSHMKDGGKDGDATDTVKDAPKGNSKAVDEHPHHKTPKGNVKFEGKGEEEDGDEESLEEMMGQYSPMGFHGTMVKNHNFSKAEASKLFQYALNKLSKHYNEKPEVVLSYLDSKGGRKFADALDKAIEEPEGGIKQVMKAFDKSYKMPEIKKGISVMKRQLGESIDVLSEMKTNNPDWGYHGTVMDNYGLKRSDAAKAFGDAAKKLMKAYKEPEEVVVAYLDGRTGRHLADDLSFLIDIEDEDNPSVPLKDVIKAFDKTYKKPYVKKGIEAIKKELGESIDVSDDMYNVRLEAQDMMDGLRDHTVSPKEAGAILRDMVQYLGGAMKTYMEMAQDIGKHAYAGLEKPEVSKEKPTEDEKSKEYVGKDDLDHVKENLDGSKL